MVAALFVLCPPVLDYYLWLLPFLELNPNAPLIPITALLRVNYFRPYFSSRSMTSICDHGIVWLAHEPLLAMLMCQGWVSRKENATGMGLYA
jgi:hypothetical protein